MAEQLVISIGVTNDRGWRYILLDSVARKAAQRGDIGLSETPFICLRAEHGPFAPPESYSSFP